VPKIFHAIKKREEGFYDFYCTFSHSKAFPKCRDSVIYRAITTKYEG